MLPGHHHTTSIPDRPGPRSGSGSGSGLGSVAGGQHPFRHNNGSNASLPSDHQSARPQRPSRRAIPSPASSFSQMTLHDNTSNPNISIESMESQRPVNRRLNRDFRIIPSTEAEGMDQFSLKDSIRHSQTLHKNSSGPEVRQRNSNRTSLVTSNNGSASQSQPKLPALLPETQEDDEDYFGDILDKYCNSDEDPTSPMTASPTSPFSSAPSWKGLRTAQPPTPPVSRSYKTPQNQNETTPPRRSAATNNGDAHRTRSTEVESLDSGRNNNGYVRSRNLSGSDSASISSSPMNAATAKFNMYLQPSSNRESRDSLSRSSPNSSPLLPSVQVSSSSSAGSTSSLVTRSYAKRPPPLPKDTPNSPGSTTTPPPAQGRESVQSRESKSSSLGLSSSMHDNSRESRPEPPPKDTSRRHHGSNGNGGSSSISSQPPFLSIDTHQGHSNNFASVVEATMNRHKVNASISSTSSGTFNFSDPSYQPQPQSQSSSRTKTSSGHSVQSSQSLHSGNGYVSEKQTHQISADSHHHRTSEGHGHGRGQSSHQSSTSRGHHDRNSHTTSHRQPLNNYQNGLAQTPYQDDAPYRKHGGSMSQLDLLGSMQRPQSGTSSNTSAPYVSERSRSYSHGSVSNTSSSRSGQGYGRALKPAILKTPIARARAKEMHGPRKVNFGEMITIVTIERAETPPPLPPVDKKQMKKQMQQAKKMAAVKEGKGGQQQNFDPEYNAEYYNAPYTPVPADVVVTLAPWIGNPNYDEEKQNSKFYYEDDYEYDEDEYETPYESDIRLGPEDDEDDDEDEDEDDEDDEEGGSHVWGHGIGGGGGSFPKKKGGMFKLKRAVNRLLRN